MAIKRKTTISEARKEGDEELLEALRTRKEVLMALLDKAESGMRKAPEGKLHILDKKSYVQYYHILEKGDTSGKYIKKSNMKLISALAKKDYDKRLLNSIGKELKQIEKLEKVVNSITGIYDLMPARRRELFTPYLMSDEQYIDEWLSYSYEGKGFWNNSTEYYTGKGERVRSKSEIIIADLLDKKGIPYRYECPLYLRGVGEIYPDFTVLNVRTRKQMYWEHMGMMGNEGYCEKALRKIESYAKNGHFLGDNLIITFESEICPLNSKIVSTMIDNYLT